MDSLRDTIERAVQEAVENMPYDEGFEVVVDPDSDTDFSTRPMTLREFFDGTWQASHGEWSKFRHFRALPRNTSHHP